MESNLEKLLKSAIEAAKNHERIYNCAWGWERIINSFRRDQSRL